ncbi:hybrid sensor histidine kinase/response regulator [Chitinophaga barathri]|uniref:histidine kinase n=1 Tax=Chitinophaga barathri TaxID=1647451 RepID=A0A3N4MSE7_9BACT|nr:hybrid sensor histidine kinase/response regulator [Chitinophaga barathri]RPD38323.1 response regulator [Chitinophaga barathri]
MNTISHYLKNIINLGAQGADANQARSIVIVNIMGIIPAIFTVIMAPILYWVTGDLAILISPLIEGSILFTIPLWNVLRRHNIAKLVMYSTHSLGLLYFGLLMGPNANIELIVVFLIGLSFLIYPNVTPRVISIAAVVGVLTILGISFGYHFVKWLVLAATILLNVMVFYFYSAHFNESIDTLVRLNKAKSQEFNRTNHETRNHLNVANTVCEEYLRNFPSDTENVTIPVRDAKALSFSINRIKEVVNNVLDYSQLEHSRPTPAYKKVDLEQWVEDLIQSYQVFAGEKNVSIVLELMPGLPDKVLADEKAMTTILSNLLSNAIKFTHADTAISVQLDAGRDNIIMRVTDQGPGLTESQRAHLFQAYITDRGNRYKGTGLGMPIVLETLKLLRGSITVKSNTGMGSAFTVTIPVTVPEQESVSPTEQLRPLGKTVLVVDDNPMNLRASEMQLKKIGCAAIKHTDVLAAIQSTFLECPHLILLDYQLNGMDGLEAIRLIRKQEHLKDVPVIITSGVAGIDTNKGLLAAGVTGFLSKPIELHRLYQYIQLSENALTTS